MAGGDAARATQSKPQKVLKKQSNYLKQGAGKLLQNTVVEVSDIFFQLQECGSSRACKRPHNNSEAETVSSRAGDTSARERTMKPIGARYLETVGPRAPLFNRWKLAAGGRPSKISEGERVRTSNNCAAATYREALLRLSL